MKKEHTKWIAAEIFFEYNPVPVNPAIVKEFVYIRIVEQLQKIKCDLQKQIGCQVNISSELAPDHSTLGYTTPEEYENMALAA